MKFDLNNKSILITGATGGIGAQIAKILITKYDCKVYGVGRNKEKAEKFKSELGDKSSSFIPVFIDLTKDSYDIFDTIPTIDVLINNAGIMPDFINTETVTSDDCNKIMESNFYAPVRLINRVLPKLKQSNCGTIVNIASSVALCPVPGTSAYSASKGALKNYSETLALDSNLFVCTVYAGFTKTDLFASLDFGSDKLLKKFASPASKTASKIVKGIRKRKQRVITGFDAKGMNLLYKLFPVKGPRLVKKILKKSGRVCVE